mmetsp:Transcript_9506/g.39089  ORF Transcript_9506/g.39089 Transcript_9506/m.39089 type:complete len:322 (+) Transcript_9506:536-1501(+)
MRRRLRRLLRLVRSERAVAASEAFEPPRTRARLWAQFFGGIISHRVAGATAHEHVYPRCATTSRALVVHVRVGVGVLRRRLSCSLRCLCQVFWDAHMLLAALLAHPAQLELERLVLALVVRAIDDLRHLNHGFATRELAELELFELCLGVLSPFANRRPTVLEALPAWLNVEQRWPVAVVACEKRPRAEDAHTPVQREQVHVRGDAVCECVGRNGLAVERLVVGRLSLRARSDLAAVWGQTRERQPCMPIDRRDAPPRARHEHLAQDLLLHTKHHTIFAANAHRRAAVVHRLARVLHLEEAAVRREGRVVEVVPRADAAHG